MSETSLWVKTRCAHCVHMGPHDPFSNEWYAHERGGTQRVASVSDLVATLQGEVVEPDSVDELGFLQITVEKPGTYVVIGPVSDGSVE